MVLDGSPWNSDPADLMDELYWALNPGAERSGYHLDHEESLFDRACDEQG